MTDDNSRGRGLKSSLKNECERDKCMRRYVHARARTHARTYTHTYICMRSAIRTRLGSQKQVMVVIVPNNDCRQIAASRLYLHANDRGYRKTITRHRIKHSTMPPQAVICP